MKKSHFGQVKRLNLWCYEVTNCNVAVCNVLEIFFL